MIQYENCSSICPSPFYNYIFKNVYFNNLKLYEPPAELPKGIKGHKRGRKKVEKISLINNNAIEQHSIDLPFHNGKYEGFPLQSAFLREQSKFQIRDRSIRYVDQRNWILGYNSLHNIELFVFLPLIQISLNQEVIVDNLFKEYKTKKNEVLPHSLFCKQLFIWPEVISIGRDNHIFNDGNNADADDQQSLLKVPKFLINPRCGNKLAINEHVKPIETEYKKDKNDMYTDRYFFMFYDSHGTLIYLRTLPRLNQILPVEPFNFTIPEGCIWRNLPQNSHRKFSELHQLSDISWILKDIMP